MTFRRPALVAIALVLAAACSGGVGEEQVAEADVEQEVSEQLGEEVGGAPPDIDCPDDLAAEVGASMECVLSVEGDDARYPVAVEVTSAEDGDATFDVEVLDEPIE